jgi:hypothetical protein
MTINSSSTNDDSAASGPWDRHIVPLVLVAWALLLILIACMATGRPAQCVGDDPLNSQGSCASVLEDVGAIAAPFANRSEA